MSFLWSLLGAVFLVGYVPLAALARVSDIRGNYTFMPNLASFIVSAPGWFILGLFGVEPEFVIVRAMCITAVLVYLLGAVIQWAAGALSG